MESALSFAIPFSSTQGLFCGMKVRLSRNIAGVHFPSKLSNTDKMTLSSSILSTLKSAYTDLTHFAAPFPHGLKETFSDISAETPHYLIDPLKQLSYCIMDQDHLVITWHTHHAEIKKLHDEISTIAHRFETLFSFAKQPQKGFLTSFPEISGLGLAIEVFLFCPLLKQMPALDEQLTLEPFFNHPSFYRLKTIKTHSLTLNALLSLILETTGRIAQAEQAARCNLQQDKKDELLDQVCKSLALLKGAYQLNFSDALTHLLNLKLGFHMGLLEGIGEEKFLHLLHLSQKAHLSSHLEQKESADDWLHERAHWLQKELAPIAIKISF